eukprot:gene16649-biopygen3795
MDPVRIYVWPIRGCVAFPRTVGCSEGSSRALAQGHAVGPTWDLGTTQRVRQQGGQRVGLGALYRLRGGEDEVQRVWEKIISL